MAAVVIDAIKRSPASEDAEAILTDLTAVHDQFQAVKFTPEEWELICEALMDDLLPFLNTVANQKTFADVHVKAIDMFKNHVVNANMSADNWNGLYKLGFKLFMTAEANKARVSGLRLLLTLVRNLAKHDKDSEDAMDARIELYRVLWSAVAKPDVDKLVKALFGILAKSSKSSPTFVQMINTMLGGLCKFHKK
jgi:hypothetical protein